MNGQGKGIELRDQISCIGLWLVGVGIAIVVVAVATGALVAVVAVSGPFMTYVGREFSFEMVPSTGVG